MNQTLRVVGRGKGFINIAVESRRYQICKEARLKDGGTGMWEIAILQRQPREAYLLSSGETPDGQFRTRREALEALRAYVAKYPVPTTM